MAMTRWLLVICIVAVVLAVPIGALSLSQTPVAEAAETAIPVYGAPAYLDGSPLGGGIGYSKTYSAADADYVVDTAAELKSALASAASGDIVYVADGATITLNSTANMYKSSVGFYVKPGVILAGGRGRSGVTAGIIRLASGFYYTSSYFLIKCGAGGDVCGLHIDGPQDGTTGDNHWGAISAGDNSEIHNNEIHGFGYAGVYVGVDINDVWVHHNYIHHCQDTGLGYGVVVNGQDIYHTSSALVEGNTFDYCRHTMAGARGRTSYTFRYNYIGSHATSHSIDCHGQNDGGEAGTYLQKDDGEYIYPAGEHIDVYNNTCAVTNRGFVRIRGCPYSGGFISVHNNWTYQKKTTLYSGSGGSWAMICEQMWYVPEYEYNAPRDSADESWGYHPWVRMEEYDNWWGTTPPPSTNAAPLTPAAPEGATSGWAGTSYSYAVKTSDPDGDMISYTIDWGDGTTSTTGESVSGVAATSSHSWTGAGTYAVSVRATDSKGLRSAWSPSLNVTIASAFQTSVVSNNPPSVPGIAASATSAVTSISYLYSAVTTDPDGDALSYTFDWGDGTVTTVPQVDSGGVAYAQHAWTLPGTYAVRVIATDSEGKVSGWSDAIRVTVIVQQAPQDSSGTGDNDSNGDAAGQVVMEEEGESQANPPSSAVDNGDSSTAPMSPGEESITAAGARGPGLLLWLLALIVMVGAAVFLTGAMVREIVPKAPRGYGDFGDRRDP